MPWLLFKVREYGGEEDKLARPLLSLPLCGTRTEAWVNLVAALGGLDANGALPTSAALGFIIELNGPRTRKHKVQMWRT